MQSHLKCPKCGTRLKVRGYSRYETLCEHVTDPNAENLPLKPRFKCPRHCYLRRMFWGVDAGVYWGLGLFERLFWKLGIYGVYKDTDVPEAIWENEPKQIEAGM